MFMLVDFITVQGNGQRCGGEGGRQPKCRCIWRHTRDRQTDWPGEKRVTRNGEPINNKEERKEGEGTAAIHFILFITCSFSLRPPCFLVLHTYTQRQRGVQDIRDHACRGALVESKKKAF